MRYLLSMTRLTLTLLLVCLSAFASVQARISIVGTWVPAKGQPDPMRILSKLQFTFKKDGTCSFLGNNVFGSGTYKLDDGKVYLFVKRRNGSSPTNSREKQGVGTIVDNGKAILIPTGEYRNGNPVLIRIVRK